MHSHDNASRRMAVGLSALAGFIDAIGFINLGGFFVSFMSGNSTRFAVGVAEGASWHLALLPLGIIALFVAGVMLGRAVRHFNHTRASSAVLVFITAVLLSAALLAETGAAICAVLLMVVAMGAANNVFVREGEVSIGVTYMTGTLVKFAQRLAASLLGERDNNWLPYFFLWLGLMSGAVLGAVCYMWAGLHAVWMAVFLSAVIAFSARRYETKINPVK